MMLVPDKHGANDDPPMTTPVALPTSDDGRNWPCTVYLANVVNLARLHAVSIDTRTALARFIRWVPVNG